MDELDKSSNSMPTAQKGYSGLGSDIRRIPQQGSRREVRISGGLPSVPRAGEKLNGASNPSSGADRSDSILPHRAGSSPHRVPDHVSASLAKPKHPSQSIVRSDSDKLRAPVQKTVGSISDLSEATRSQSSGAPGKIVPNALNSAQKAGIGEDDATVSVTDLEVDRASGKISGSLETASGNFGSSGKPSESGNSGVSASSGDIAKKLGKTADLSADPDFSDVPMATLPVGMKIDDRYEILSVLGVGGFATVYRAHHLTIDRDVALKVMDLKKGVDPSYSERFFREAKIAAKIHHNNVVSIYDFGHVSETGQPYIAMEMLHGHDLSHELTKNGPLSPNRAFILFRPVLDALSEGHRLGIVHKDLKPENLYLVDPGGSRELMKILDFGVARINSSEVAKLTSAGQLLGTPRYLAPEYITSQEVSPAIDVYQMALIMSEALTGVPAVSGDPFHAMMLHCSGQIQIADFLLEGRVGEVFRKAIATDVAERYENCAVFAEALDTVADCFSGDVPLTGGAPQRTPEIQTTPRALSNMMGSKATGAYGVSPTPSSEIPSYAPQAKSNALRNAFLILLLLACALGAIYYFGFRRPKNIAAEKAAAAAQAEAEKPDPKFEFAFDSDPQGAQVTRNTRTICVTPCRSEFKLSELQDEYKPLIVFKLDGYSDEMLEITEDLVRTSQGKVSVEMKKIVAKELPFKFEYTPKTATVAEIGTGKIVCELSPCTYVFRADQVAVTLTFSAPNYVSQNLALTAADFDEKPISVNLVKEAGAVKKAKQTKAVKDSKDDAQDDAKKNEIKKEEKKTQPTIKTMF